MSSLAVLGLINAALSQTTLVIGSGASWSHALFTNRPSKAAADGKNETSIPAPGLARALTAVSTFFALAEGFTDEALVPAMKPS